MIEALGFTFIQHAVVAALLTSVACGIIGTLVVVNRLVFIAGGIAHASYGGVGLAFLLGISPLFGATVFAVLLAALVAYVTMDDKHRADTVIGVIWAVGMAMGIIFIDLTSGYNVDLMSYLFGSILAVPVTDLYLMGVLITVTLGCTIYFYRDIHAMSFDEEFAVTLGVPVKKLYFLVIILIALAVVMMIRAVGLILILALLTIPPYIAERYTKTLFGMMLLSTLLSAVFTMGGLIVSFYLNLTTGATIILIASLFFTVSSLIKKRR